jgi:hypothetical protein
MRSATPGIPVVGALLTTSEGGISTCWKCWWRGVATKEAGFRWCPFCTGQMFDAEYAAMPEPLPAGVASLAAATGRNAPCPCGSGRKFKKCHG